jgi:Protein of unknown function (DUF2946)
MAGRGHGLTRVGRQFAAIVLTFALLLQGVATGRLAANAATDADWAAFELCHHNSSADDGNASAPAGVPENSDAHCIFCLAGASHALQAPLPSVAFHIIIIAIVPWTFTVWRLPALTVYATARPRGPPPTA